MTVQLKIPTMACSACVSNITKAVQSLDSAATLTADLTSKQVSIESDRPLAAIAQAITQAGYPVQAE